MAWTVADVIFSNTTVQWEDYTCAEHVWTTVVVGCRWVTARIKILIWHVSTKHWRSKSRLHLEWLSSSVAVHRCSSNCYNIGYRLPVVTYDNTIVEREWNRAELAVRQSVSCGHEWVCGQTDKLSLAAEAAAAAKNSLLFNKGYWIVLREFVVICIKYVSELALTYQYFLDCHLCLRVERVTYRQTNNSTPLLTNNVKICKLRDKPKVLISLLHYKCMSHCKMCFKTHTIYNASYKELNNQSVDTLVVININMPVTYGARLILPPLIVTTEDINTQH